MMDKNCLRVINQWPQRQTRLRAALDMASALQVFGHRVKVHLTVSALLLLEANNAPWDDAFAMMQELGVEFTATVESFINFSQLKPTVPLDALKPEDTKKLMQSAHFVWNC